MIRIARPERIFYVNWAEQITIESLRMPRMENISVGIVEVRQFKRKDPCDGGTLLSLPLFFSIFSFSIFHLCIRYFSQINFVLDRNSKTTIFDYANVRMSERSPIPANG